MKARLVKLSGALAMVLMASGSFLASANTNGYKMVIIENTPGSTALQAGELDQGITETLNSSAEVDTFARQMSLCVGYIPRQGNCHKQNKLATTQWPLRNSLVRLVAVTSAACAVML